MARVTVEFNEDMTRSLTDLGSRLGVTRAEILMRSVAVYDYLDGATRAGHDVLVSRQADEVSFAEMPKTEPKSPSASATESTVTQRLLDAIYRTTKASIEGSLQEQDTEAEEQGES
jgi:hypothetical protein